MNLFQPIFVILALWLPTPAAMRHMRGMQATRRIKTMRTKVVQTLNNERGGA